MPASMLEPPCPADAATHGAPLVVLAGLLLLLRLLALAGATAAATAAVTVAARAAAAAAASMITLPFLEAA